MLPRTGDTGRALFAWAVAQGWASDLHPQYKTGPYEIDLAILREGKKIALFIDGEGTPDPEAIRRSIGHQLILERAGWTCMRIQAMDWQLRREGVEEMLRGV